MVKTNRPLPHRTVEFCNTIGAKRTCIGVWVRALLNFSIALGSKRRADPRPLPATLAP